MLFVTTAVWRQAYPDACAGVLAMYGVENPAAHPGLEQRKPAVLAALREQFAGLDPHAIRDLPTIRAYNAYYKRFKKNYHVQQQLESVVYKDRPIPSVAALVEAMFMAELRSQLLTAGHDLDKLALPVTLDVAQGGETYTLLRGAREQVKAGDMLMRDGAGIISSILYGPDQRTQIGPETRNVLFTVYAPPGIQPGAVTHHLEEIRDSIWLVTPGARVGQLDVF